MDVSLVVSGIQAVMRAAQTGVDIYKQANVDRAIYLSNIRIVKADITETLTRFVDENRHVTTVAPFANGWNASRGLWLPTDSENLQSCIAAYTVMMQTNDTVIVKGKSEALAGGHLISQWRQDNKPPSVLARVALTITDIGLSFIAQNPALMGENSKGETLVLSFASSLSDIIPDDVDDFGKRHDFESRLVGVFLKAGLNTLLNDKNAVIKKESVSALVKGIIVPINEALPSGFNEQFKYRDLVDTLIGPSTSNALAIIAKTPQAYLGSKFEHETAFTAVTQAILKATSTASAVSVQDVFTKEGLTLIVDAVLNVAIEQPALFIDESKQAYSVPLSELLVNTASMFKTVNENHSVSQDFAAELTAMVITTVGKHATVLVKIDTKNPWETLALDLTKSMLMGIGSNLTENKRFILFSAPQRMEYARLILQQLSESPHMIAKHNKAVQHLISGLASVMAKDEHLLLSNDDWLDIVATAATIAGMNPQLLFGFDSSKTIDELDASSVILVTAIDTVLEVINQLTAFEAQARQAIDDGKSHALDIMQGLTLNHIVQAVLQALANDIAGLKEHPDILVRYFTTLLEQIIENPEKWGSRNIIDFVESSIDSVFMSGELPAILTALEQRN